MATVHIALAYWTSVSQTNTGLAVPSSRIIADQIMVSSGTSQTTLIACPGDPAGVSQENYHQTTTTWVVTASGGSVYVRFGGTAATPASSPSDNEGAWLILTGQTRYFTAYPGDTASVIDAGV